MNTPEVGAGGGDLICSPSGSSLGKNASLGAGGGSKGERPGDIITCPTSSENLADVGAGGGAVKLSSVAVCRGEVCAQSRRG
jgi:hypothetical protein